MSIRTSVKVHKLNSFRLKYLRIQAKDVIWETNKVTTFIRILLFQVLLIRTNHHKFSLEDNKIQQAYLGKEISLIKDMWCSNNKSKIHIRYHHNKCSLILRAKIILRRIRKKEILSILFQRIKKKKIE